MDDSIILSAWWHTVPALHQLMKLSTLSTMHYIYMMGYGVLAVFFHWQVLIAALIFYTD